MASYRQLPSKKWQATVRLVDGRRVTRTSTLKSVVKVWAEEEERRLRRGEWTDPRHARHTVGDWLDLWSAAKVVEDSTERADRAGIARIHKEFGARPIGTVTRIEVQGWVKRMQTDGVGPHAVRRAYNSLAGAYTAAVLEGLVVNTPCRRIALPPAPLKIPAWYTEAQVDAIVNELGEPHATMTLAMCLLGLRWGECAGLRVQDVDWLRRKVRVVGAVTQTGAWKEYPKTAMSRRELPAPEWLIERMSLKAPAEGLLFRTRRQGLPMRANNWRIVWNAALTRASVPVHTPHVCRHTAATWLVQQGVGLYDVQVFMGHEDPKTTMRYSHHGPDANGRIEAAWKQMSHLCRTGTGTGL